MMNKIKVTDSNIDINVDDKIEVTIFDRFEIFDVKKMVIKILEDTDLEIEYNLESSKMDIQIIVLENKTLNLFELKECGNIKTQYEYVLEKNSTLNIDKFYDVKEVKELDVVELDGEGANINFKLKTLATNDHKYDMFIYHNAKNTISNIINNGINVDGSIIFNITGIVYNNISGCEINQANRIVTFNDKKCIITPKLLIDENDVIANHSALIGKFSEDEIFYLQSRGIDYNTAIRLLVKGLLLENTNDERLNKIIEKYWR